MSTPRPTERDERLRSELASLRIDRDQAAATPARRRRLRLWVTLVVLAPVRGTVLSGSGYVVTGEKYISIGVRVPGRIERYFVEEGRSVHAGDPLVALDDRDYLAAVAQAEAALHTAEANLALHQADLRRISALHERRIVSRADLDTAVNRAAVDR